MDLASDAVKKLLLALARRHVDEPEVGIEMGEFYWPIEAVWTDRKVIIVDGEDDERDASLSGDGYAVFHANRVDADEIEPLLSI